MDLHNYFHSLFPSIEIFNVAEDIYSKRLEYQRNNKIESSGIFFYHKDVKPGEVLKLNVSRAALRLSFNIPVIKEDILSLEDDMDSLFTFESKSSEYQPVKLVELLPDKRTAIVFFESDKIDVQFSHSLERNIDITGVLF